MDTFSALADPTRRHIIELLAIKGELSASEIVHKFSLTPPAISQHLKVLRDTDMVRVEKRAQMRLYQINPQKIEEVEVWVKKLKHKWEERFDVLDVLLKKKH